MAGSLKPRASAISESCARTTRDIREPRSVLRVPRSSFARKYEDFADEIADYLTANVVWTPCRLTFSVDGVHKKSFQRGWTRTDADLREMVVESLRPGGADAGELPEGLLSAEGKARRRREVEHWQGVVGEAAGTLRLPNGRRRSARGTWALSGHNSFF